MRAHALHVNGLHCMQSVSPHVATERLQTLLYFAGSFLWVLGSFVGSGTVLHLFRHLTLACYLDSCQALRSVPTYHYSGLDSEQGCCSRSPLCRVSVNNYSGDVILAEQ